MEKKINKKSHVWGIEIAYDSNLSLSPPEMPPRSIIYETESVCGDWEGRRVLDVLNSRLNIYSAAAFLKD